MHLIDEIIEILSSTDSDLSNALTKAQVLAHKLGEDGLASWVKSELVGYPRTEDIPEYRCLNLSVYGTISNGVYTYNRHRLQTIGLPEHLRENFLKKRVGDSIAVIQSWSAKESLIAPFPPETYHYFSQNLTDTYQIQSAWGAFSEGAFIQILVEVRSRLLDLMLHLSDKIPANPDDPKQVSKDIDVNGIFKGAVFGDGATVNFAVGSNSSAVQHNDNRVVKNDLSSLKAILEHEKVSVDDLAELEAAIDEDNGSEDHAKSNLGTKVRTWAGKMFLKAGTAAWDVSTKTAAAVLTTALNQYYGFG